MKAFLRYASLLLIVLFSLSVYIPKRYQTDYPKQLGPQLDDNIRYVYVDALERDNAEFVLMGDSTLAPAVDEILMEEHLGKEILSIGLPGTAATLWYLIIKNNIVAATYKPKYLILFIRDSVMTVPYYRTTGTYFKLIDEFADSGDDVLLEKAYINRMSAIGRMAEKYFPLFGSRWKIRETIDFYIRYPLPKIIFDCDKECMTDAMRSVFVEADIDEKHLNDALFVADSLLYQKNALDFNNTVKVSFLPDIIRLCRENNIQLILVRMETMRFPTKKEEPPGLEPYFENMQKYLAENDVIYLDLSRNESIKREHFVDDLHMNSDGQAVFTPIFIRELEKVIE